MLWNDPQWCQKIPLRCHSEQSLEVSYHCIVNFFALTTTILTTVLWLWKFVKSEFLFESKTRKTFCPKFESPSAGRSKKHISFQKLFKKLHFLLLFFFTRGVYLSTRDVTPYLCFIPSLTFQPFLKRGKNKERWKYVARNLKRFRWRKQSNEWPRS